MLCTCVEVCRPTPHFLWTHAIGQYRPSQAVCRAVPLDGAVHLVVGLSTMCACVQATESDPRTCSVVNRTVLPTAAAKLVLVSLLSGPHRTRTYWVNCFSRNNIFVVSCSYCFCNMRLSDLSFLWILATTFFKYFSNCSSLFSSQCTAAFMQKSVSHNSPFDKGSNSGIHCQLLLLLLSRQFHSDRLLDQQSSLRHFPSCHPHLSCACFVRFTVNSITIDATFQCVKALMLRQSMIYYFNALLTYMSGQLLFIKVTKVLCNRRCCLMFKVVQFTPD